MTLVSALDLQGFPHFCDAEPQGGGSLENFTPPPRWHVFRSSRPTDLLPDLISARAY